MYLHYIHFQKEWFVSKDDCSDKKVYSLYGFTLLPNSYKKTKKEITKILKDKFPNDVLVYTIMYHEGPRYLKYTHKKLVKTKRVSSIMNSNFISKRNNIK